MAKLSIRQHADRDAAEVYYLDAVDNAASRVSPYITAVREAKWQEVLGEGGPMLEAEAEALGSSLQSVVDSVKAARQHWCESEAVREAARIRAKTRIRQADTPADMHRAYTDYTAVLKAAFLCPEET